MALSSEDRKDVSTAMGKALAKKVSDSTKDKLGKGYPGYRNMSGASRRNARMDRIFSDSKVYKEAHAGAVKEVGKIKDVNHASRVFKAYQDK